MAAVRDDELRAALFLVKEDLEEKKSLKRRGIDLESIYFNQIGMRQSMDTLASTVMAQGMRSNRHAGRIRALETWRDASMETNGHHVEATLEQFTVTEEDSKIIHSKEIEHARELVELRKFKEDSERDRKDSMRYKKRKMSENTFAIILVVITAAVTSCASYGAWYVQTARLPTPVEKHP